MCSWLAREGSVMLILTRKPGESIYIGDGVKITIVEIKGHQIRVGIEAPKELRIYREEIYLQILEENKEAAEAAMSSDATGLENLTQSWGGRKIGKKGSEKSGSLSAFGGKRSGGKGDPEVQVRRKKKKQSDE